MAGQRWVQGAKESDVQDEAAGVHRKQGAQKDERRVHRHNKLPEVSDRFIKSNLRANLNRVPEGNKERKDPPGDTISKVTVEHLAVEVNSKLITETKAKTILKSKAHKKLRQRAKLVTVEKGYIGGAETVEFA